MTSLAAPDWSGSRLMRFQSLLASDAAVAGVQWAKPGACMAWASVGRAGRRRNQASSVLPWASQDASSVRCSSWRAVSLERPLSRKSFIE
eukprot:2888125-Pyramimonas_sp.AAC.2